MKLDYAPENWELERSTEGVRAVVTLCNAYSPRRTRVLHSRWHHDGNDHRAVRLARLELEQRLHDEASALREERRVAWNRLIAIFGEQRLAKVVCIPLPSLRKCARDGTPCALRVDLRFRWLVDVLATLRFDGRRARSWFNRKMSTLGGVSATEALSTLWMPSDERAQHLKMWARVYGEMDRAEAIADQQRRNAEACHGATP